MGKMARPSTGANLNIAQLEQILNERRTSLIRLEKQKKKLMRDLEAVDREIARIGGAGASANGAGRLSTGVRARNEKSLPQTLEDVLRQAGRPMKIAEIADAVIAAGYRSTSDNFRAIVNQTLIKERKRFAPGGERGTYQLRK